MHRRSFTIEEMKRRPLLVELVLVGAFNQEKALVGAFSVIVKIDCETDGALHSTTNKDVMKTGESNNKPGVWR